MKTKGWGRIINFASLQRRAAFEWYRLALQGRYRPIDPLWLRRGPRTARHCKCRTRIFPTELTGLCVCRPRTRSACGTENLYRAQWRRDIDGPLLFLCSDASAYVTGQILMVDGDIPQNESAGL
jgi:gluconate 5-dehydrogenase